MPNGGNRHVPSGGNSPIKRPLKLKTALGIGCIALLLTTVAISLSYTVYVRALNDHYALLAQHVADTAVLKLDGDRIRGYYDALLKLDPHAPDYHARIQTVKDDDYNQMLDYLYGVRRANEVLYLYVGVPDFDRMTYTYIMDADKIGIARELGYTETLSEEMGIYADALEQRIPPVFTNTEEFGPLVTTSRPIYDSKGDVVAVTMVDLSMQTVWDDRQSYLLFTTALMLLITSALAAAFVGITNKAIVTPVNHLALAAANYVSDQEQLGTGSTSIERLDIHTGDEVENLCVSIKKMEKDLRSYIADLTLVTAEKERIGAELDVAKHIQASMLPCIFPAFPERPELDIYATMTPAKEVGGDFYDFFLVDDDRLAMVMADVSGKGVPAALFMVIAKTLLKNVAQTGLSPKAVLEKVNNQLCVNNEAEMFVTVWLGILEISTGKMVCANAGHEYPVLKRAGGDYELVKDRHGFVLAGMEASHYKEYELQMNPGDRLFLYTDGVAEATDAHDELYGTDRMLAALNLSKDANCEALLYRVQADIDAFVGEAPQFDDITMLSLELTPQKGAAMRKLKLSPTLAAIEQVTAFVEKELEAADVSMKSVIQMNIAADEVFSNIARYSGATDATVGVSVEDGRITLRFADNGRPYDPTGKPDPDITLSAEERDVGGLGIFMVKKSMDTVEYEYHDGLNILTLTKRS
ncbi:MAG: SpoIIE family protein phosphatase [Clostridia bacterium]